jgi:hypothetical protein
LKISLFFAVDSAWLNWLIGASSGANHSKIFMKKFIPIFFVALGMVTAGCFRPGVKGDGVVKAEDRTISDFTKVMVAGAYEVQWTNGKAALNISADENILPLIKTVVTGGTLEIESSESISPSRAITITLSSAALTGVELTGGNSFKASQVAGDALKLEATGASNITVDGSVTNLQAEFTGAGKLKARSLQTRTATLTLTGASEAEVNVSDALKVSITGAGSLTYSGDPKVEQEITGAGSVRHLP